MQRNPFPTRKGFTLIELLVVIAIIAILAAILFPVFAKAREKAKQTTCISNMKQIGIAMQSYVTDSDEKFPIYSPSGTNEWYSVEDFHTAQFNPLGGKINVTNNNGQDRMKTISWQLDRYIKSREVWQCPADFGPYRRDDWWNVGYNQFTLKPLKDWLQWGTNEKVGVSYGYRGTNDSPGGQDRLYQTSRDPATGSIAGYSLTDVKNPSERWMFWDHRGWHHTQAGNDRATQVKGRVQALAFDTHVATLNQGDVLDPNSDKRNHLFTSILIP